MGCKISLIEEKTSKEERKQMNTMVKGVVLPQFQEGVKKKPETGKREGVLQGNPIHRLPKCSGVPGYARGRKIKNKRIEDVGRKRENIPKMKQKGVEQASVTENVQKN